MTPSVAPMIHVSDVAATTAWYVSIGFSIIQTYDDGGDRLNLEPSS